MKKSILYLIFFTLLITSPKLFSQEINWLTIEEAEIANKTAPRKIIIDVYTDWCGWCKKMDATTFTNKEVVTYLNKKYYCVKLDGEDKNEIYFKGKVFNFVDQGRRGYHELAAGFLKGKMSYPNIVFLNEELDILQALPGFRTAEELLPILKFLGDDIYKNTNWTDYIKTLEGEK
ncbi:MAG: DUF255 domain-containing protein [Flavobacteriaceae bacterium]|nr:DUF255 domain-containing protein [Flavobacteriaceae bacterium]